MRNFISFLLLSFFSLTNAMAAENDSIYVHGRIVDAITREDIDSVSVTIEEKMGTWSSGPFFTRDAITNRAELIKEGIPADQIPVIIRYNCPVPHAGTYIVTTHKKGYTDREVEISVPARQGIRKTKEWAPKDILLQRRTEHELGEAVVKATRIMMVNRGDTVVFNADYFQLSQGSMLDALVEKMPGLEIREGGEIFYQGRKLDNLLVNGKEFFKGDPTVALLNLPAYTVKEVKIYKKLDRSQAFSMTDDEKSASAKTPNTLDVVLKREYSHGWIANAEVGTPLTPRTGGIVTTTSEKPSISEVSVPPVRGARGGGLARLFGLHFSDTSRFGIYGNVNNVNDSQTAGSGGKWSSGWTPANGITKMAMGGILFQKYWKSKGLDYTGDFRARREQTDTEDFTSSTTFLDGSSSPQSAPSPVGEGGGRGQGAAQTFRRSHTTQQNEQTHLLLEQGLNYENERKDIYLEAHATTEYVHRRTPSESLSAQFGADPLDAYRGASLDSLYVGPSSPRLSSILTNQLAQRNLDQQDSWNQTLTGDLSFRSPLLGNGCSWYYHASYQQEDGSNHNLYDLQTPLAPRAGGMVTTSLEGSSEAGVSSSPRSGGTRGVALNRYTDQFSRRIGTANMFAYRLNDMFSESWRRKLALRIDYNFSYGASWNNRGIYNLQTLPLPLPEWRGEVTTAFYCPSVYLVSTPFPRREGSGMGPSCIDAPNSHRTFTRSMSNVIGPSVGFGNADKRTGYFNANLNFDFTRQYMERRAFDDASIAASQTGTADRHYAFFTPSLRWYRSIHRDREDGRHVSRWFSLDYNFYHSPADINYFLPIRDDSDPLALHLSNDQLQASSTHKLKFYTNYKTGEALHMLTLDASFIQQAVAMGYDYNAATGAYTYQPQNVNGNRSFTAQWNSSLPFGKTKRWNLYAEANYNLLNSVDIVNAQRSEVLNQNASITFQLQYRFGNMGYVLLETKPRYDRATSQRPGFTTRSTWDFNHGASLNLTPVKDLTLTSNFNVYQRRGYDDATMNDNNFIWNASLSYAFDFRRSSYRSTVGPTFGNKSEVPNGEGGGRGRGGTGARPWSVTLEGFDLLHQLSNTRRVLNSQGITETWTNSLPSYVMLHISYRWSKQPKKK